MREGRYETTIEQLTIPYRNGILHGMDLGYDNQIVAAKTWAALFATREWALKAERGLLTAPPEESKKTPRETVLQKREIADDTARLQECEPRDIQIGVDVPARGDPDTFDIGTPERKLAAYLSYWKAGNYGYMAKCLPRYIEPPTKRIPGLVRQEYATKRLIGFEFVEISDDTPAVTEIQTRLVYEEGGQQVEGTARFRLLYIDRDGHPAVRGKPGSAWAVLDLSIG